MAVYARSSIPSAIWNAPNNDRNYELLWVQAGRAIVGALYHPPKAQYSQQSLLDYIEQSVDDLSKQFPDSVIVLDGDMNQQLADNSIIEQTGLIPIIFPPTRQSNILDRVYVSDTCYCSQVDGKKWPSRVAVYHDTDNTKYNYNRSRKNTDLQETHAQFLAHIAVLKFEVDDNDKDVRCVFDDFYDKLLALLNEWLLSRKNYNCI